MQEVSLTHLHLMTVTESFSFSIEPKTLISFSLHSVGTWQHEIEIHCHVTVNFNPMLLDFISSALSFKAYPLHFTTGGIILHILRNKLKL